MIMTDKNIMIGYIVLHYLVYETTTDCILSLQNQISDSDVVIVVDNNSNNKSLEMLQQRFSGDSRIIFIKNNSNLGFAKGNNVGFKYLKDNFNPELIVMLNNDVIIEQDDWRNILLNIYARTKFDLLGPEILDLHRIHTNVNPQKPTHTSLTRIKIGRLINEIKYVTSYVGLDILIEKLLNMKSFTANNNEKKECFDVQLSGCCWIFGKRYIDLYDGLNPETFLYLEEQILYARIKRNNMISVYSPKIEVVHLEDMSTNMMLKNQGMAKKRRFKYKCQRDSFKVLERELEDYFE